MGIFILEHGRAFEPDERTFEGWTGEPKNCFGNSTEMVVMKDPTLNYVEGYAKRARARCDHLHRAAPLSPPAEESNE
jgi:hypothetical protein